MAGPTHSDRNFKLMKPINMNNGDYIIEVWDGSNWNDDTKTREMCDSNQRLYIFDLFSQI